MLSLLWEVCSLWPLDEGPRWPACPIGLGIALDGDISTVAEHYRLWLELFCAGFKVDS